MPAVTTYSLSGNPYIDGLLGETKWATTSLTFSFPSSGAHYESPYGDGEPSDNFGKLNTMQEAAARSSLAMYARVSDLAFTEMAESSTHHADLRYAMSDTPPTAWAYLPSTAPEGGDVWFNRSSGLYDSPAKGNYAYSTFLHETGHALGLEHPHTGNVMPLNRDSLEYSVMSYRSFIGASLNGGYTNEKWGYPQSLMMYDIAAIQHLYGPNFSSNSGNTAYSWSPSTGEMFINGAAQGAPGENRIFLTVWDGGGIDTYNFSNYGTDLSVDLRPGGWTTTSASHLAKLHYNDSEVAAGNIANALLFKGDLRSLIENARGGSGDDVIRGNSADNKIWGGGGDDVIRGGPGHDKLFGGAADDRLLGNSGLDVLRGGGGDDVVRGAGGNDRLIGGPGDDSLVGGPGDDVITGGPGGDLLVGGNGADNFVFRSTNHSPPGAKDTIQDFDSGVDRIILKPIDANTTVGGNQAFSFIGSDPFSHTAGELNFRNKVLSGDVDGDGTADFSIDFTGGSTPMESDFIL